MVWKSPDSDMVILEMEAAIDLPRRFALAIQVHLQRSGGLHRESFRLTESARVCSKAN
jgi:hypothetical protein